MDRAYTDVVGPNENVQTVYVRVVFVRVRSGQPELLMQELDNGHFQFPGGVYKPSDGDAIEALVRELSEETKARPRFLRTLRTVDLLYGSQLFVMNWRGNRDVCFVLRWEGGYRDLSIGKDAETVQTLWVGIPTVLNCRRRLYRNTRCTISYILRMLPNWPDITEGV